MVADSALANPRVFIKQSLDSHVDDTDLMNATHATWAAEELLTKQRIMLRSCEVNQDLVNLMNRGIIGESAVARRTDARTGLQNADAHDDIVCCRYRFTLRLRMRLNRTPGSTWCSWNSSTHLAPQ